MKEVEGYGITKTDGRALLHLAAWVHERIISTIGLYP
jgi:hypothetical protein